MTKQLAIARTFLTCAFCLLPCAFAHAQFITRQAGPAPRDSLREITGTGTLTGIVLTDDQSAQPVPRVRVELSIEGQPTRSAYTDARGNFAFRALPAGRYLLAAVKPAFVRAAYGANRPGRPGTAITLADGQRLDNLKVRIAKGSVITGTVRDELGQPAPGVSVSLMQYRVQNGERTLGPAPGASLLLDEGTDDRGMYRLYGLPPGEYVVVATPRALGTGDVRQMTPAEIQAVQRAIQSAQAGAATAGQPAPPPTTVTYAPVFYPGTTSAAGATTVTVGSGEERTGVDLGLQLVRTARVDGVVTSPNGSPQMADLVMVPSIPTAAAPMLKAGPMMMALNRVRPDAEGKFSYSGVAPGKYTISARLPNGSLWAQADVTVDGENVTGVALDLQPGLTIAGRVVVDDPTADPPPNLSAARVSLAPGGSGVVMIGINIGGGADGRADAQGQFAIGNVVPGKYRLDAQLGGSWTLKSAVVGGKDTLDFPFEVGPNERISDAVVTFTNKTQEVAGALQDAAGRPAPDFTIVVFPADKTYWTSTRRIKTARPGTDGRYVIRGLPAGEYRIAALVDIAPGEQNDPAILAELVQASVPFTLRDGDRKVQDIRLAK